MIYGPPQSLVMILNTFWWHIFFFFWSSVLCQFFPADHNKWSAAGGNVWGNLDVNHTQLSKQKGSNLWTRPSALQTFFLSVIHSFYLFVYIFIFFKSGICNYLFVLRAYIFYFIIFLKSSDQDCWKGLPRVKTVNVNIFFFSKSKYCISMLSYVYITNVDHSW